MFRRLEFILPTFAALWLVGIFTIAVVFSPAIPATLSVQWATDRLNVAAPSSPPMDLTNHDDPRSRYHLSRFRIAEVPVRFNRTLDAPVSLSYEVFDSDAGERRTYTRTIPPGLATMELPFYLGDRSNELRTEKVICTLIKAGGYDLGSQATAEVDFLARGNSAYFHSRTGSGQTAHPRVDLREFADREIEIHLQAESPTVEAVTVNLSLAGSAVDAGIFQLPESPSLRFEKGETESDKLKLRVTEALSGKECTLVVSGKTDASETADSNLVIGAELQIRVIPAAPARFSVTAPDAVAEGEPFTVSIDLKSGEISPEGIPIDFRLLNTQRFSIDPSSPTKVTSSERTLIRAIATPNLIAFDNADCNFVMEINGDRLAVPVAIVDKTPQLVSVTPSNEEVKVTEGSAIQWDISLPESVHASKQLTFHATITSEDGAEIRALTTNPPFEIVNGIAEISIPLAANESSTSLTIKAENNDQTDESNKQYVVRFQTNQQLWTAAEGFPSRVLLTVTDDDSYSLIPLEKLAVVESEASATLAVLRIDPPRPVDIELRFKAIGDSAGQEDFTIDLPQDASGFYRIKAAANSDAISIPVKANLDSKTEDPERFDLVFDSAKIPEPVSVQIRDPDVTGDVLVLVIATPAISSTLQETVADVASEFKETDGVLVDNSIYIVDNSESSYVRVPLDHPLPDLTFFETDASPVSMDKAISAWKSLNDQFSGRNRQLRRTIIVWKSSFSGDSSDGYAGWKNRPDNRFHLIWIGGQSGEDIQTSNLVESLTTLQNSGEAKLPLIPYRSDYLRIGDATQKLLRIELP